MKAKPTSAVVVDKDVLLPSDSNKIDEALAYSGFVGIFVGQVT